VARKHFVVEVLIHFLLYKYNINMIQLGLTISERYFKY